MAHSARPLELNRHRTLPAVIARAPTRIDFGGGWTDVPPYDVERGGRVCNLAIARYATATVRERRATATPSDDALVRAALHRLGADAAVGLHSDFPVGAGLGGSSAAGVATLAALSSWIGEPLAGAALAEASRALEVEELGIAGGRQDHYAAAIGGALDLGFGVTVDVRRIALPPDCVRAIESRCVVAYTGKSRISGETITAVRDAYRGGERRVVGALARMAALAGEMADALTRGALDDLAALVDEHWTHQRALHPAITTPRIDALYDAARRAGARGFKALGASGGGCVLAIADAGREADVGAALGALAIPFPFTVSLDGCRVTAAPDEGEAVP